MYTPNDTKLHDELEALESLPDNLTEVDLEMESEEDNPELQSVELKEQKKPKKKKASKRTEQDRALTYNPVKEYLREISNYPLLDREEEIRIYERINQGRQMLGQGLSFSRTAMRELEKMIEELESGVRSPHTTFRNPDAGRTRRKTELSKAVKEMKKQIRTILRGFREEDSGQLSERQLENRYKKWANIINDMDLDINALWRLTREVRETYRQMKEMPPKERDQFVQELGDSPKRLKKANLFIREGLKEIRDARQAMIRGNLRLVVSVAKRYKHCGIPMLDLIQEGNLGLTRAVDKFDASRGTKFSTYAVWWIRQSISRAVKQQRRTIRLPTGVTDQIAQVDRANTELTQKLGRQPSVAELAEQLEMEEDRVADLLGWQQDPLSLETPVREDRETTIGELIKDNNEVPADSRMIHNVLDQRIENVLGQLSEREETILRLRYGLSDGKVWKLGDIGKRFGITRERVRQIEQRAIRKLRHPNRAREIRDFLN